ncbi:winged helix-turn-helix transcriptional regulator [Virgibacillus dakarensis]|uniref:helix-turn-helix domain-containing protein n=1 Tax=Virgibacillus dakarensis TaxID=1917889 RepID=UPI000B435024|nr:winged helix-turn-helix transcriptional regulator [Virgibacillus dakarensis]
MSNLSYLSDYATFNSTQELNHNVTQHEKAHQDALNATDRNILRFISRYSVKYSGASHLKVATIAQGVEKSERTVRRVIRRLEALGIVEKVGTSRKKSGGDGANIYRILPYLSERMTERAVDEKARRTTEGTSKRGSEPLRKHYYKYVLDTAGSEIVERYAIRNNIPEPLYDILSPFFYGKELRRYVGIIFRAKTSKTRIEAHTEAFKACLADCIKRYKDGTVRSLDGYLYASVRRLSRKLFLEGDLPAL